MTGLDRVLDVNTLVVFALNNLKDFQPEKHQYLLQSAYKRVQGFDCLIEFESALKTARWETFTDIKLGDGLIGLKSPFFEGRPHLVSVEELVHKHQDSRLYWSKIPHDDRYALSVDVEPAYQIGISMTVGFNYGLAIMKELMFGTYAQPSFSKSGRGELSLFEARLRGYTWALSVS